MLHTLLLTRLYWANPGARYGRATIKGVPAGTCTHERTVPFPTLPFADLSRHLDRLDVEL